MNNNPFTSPVAWLFEIGVDGVGFWYRLTRIFLWGVLILGFVLFGAWNFEQLSFGALDWRYLLPPATAFLGTLVLAARFLQDIFEIESFRRVFKYLMTALFFTPALEFWKYPKVVIENGSIDLDDEDLLILKKIGGPANVYIRPGNAIEVGYIWQPSEIFDIGWHPIRRFGKIKGIVDLREQECFLEPFEAVSKDGIPVEVKDAKFRYRVFWDSEEPERSRMRPYPYAEQAVKKIAGFGDPKKWQDTVAGQFKAVITGFISEHQFDYITNFKTIEVRGELRRLMDKEGKPKFRNNGAELLWFDLGRFDYEQAIKQQHLHKWKSTWAGEAMVERAYGEAQILAYQELGRAEAQAEMLMSVIHALNTIGISDNPQQRRKNIQSLILIRTAQILDNLSDHRPGG